jgi:hypothetical protein
VVLIRVPPSTRGICSAPNGNGAGVLSQYFRFTVNIIPPTLHTDRHLKATLSKGLTDEVWGPSERSDAFTESVEHRTRKC